MQIDGNRVRLRDWRLSDVEPYTHWHRPGHAWRELDGPYYPRSTNEDVDRMADGLRRRIEAAEWPEVRRRLVIADPSDDQLIGSVSWYWIGEETNWLAIGITVFDPARWRKGIGYEALGLWCAYLWGAMPDLVRLDLRTWSGNVGMMRLAQKLGFREEARFRNARVVNGALFDGLGYGVLREEWEAAFPNGFGNEAGRTRQAGTA